MNKNKLNTIKENAVKKLQKNKITLSTYNDILFCLSDIFKDGKTETIIQDTADFFTDNKATVKPCGIGYKIIF